MAKVPLFISELNASSIYFFLRFTRGKLLEDDENTFGEKLLVDAIDEYLEEFEKHKALVNDAVTTAENLHGRYLGALRNNEYEVAQSISQAILLNKETESRAFENALLEFKEKSLANYANFNNLP